MASSGNIPAKLDILQALRQSALAFWRDFAPIIMLGFMFLTLPSLLVHLMASTATEGGISLGTLLQTLTALLGMIFACAVNFGIMAALAGRPLDPGDFIRAGLRASRPGIIVALIIGAVIMTMTILLYLFQSLSPFAGMIVMVLAIWLIAALIVAIPAAIAEQRQPFDALRRSFELTRGNRGRIIGLIIVATIAFLPAAMIVNTVIFGPGATKESALAELQAMTLMSPGLWIVQLFYLLVYGLLATIPAVIYAQLTGLGRR